MRTIKLITDGFTLVELVISITLIGMVMIAVVALDVSTRNFLTSAEYESRVQNEISPVLEKIVKDATTGIGDVNNKGVLVPVADRVDIRRPDGNNPPTYNNYNDDPWVRYGFNIASYQITTRTRASAAAAWSGPEILANEVVDCQFALSGAGLNVLSITITARRDATLPVDRKNPEVRLETSAFLRSQSIN